jgi:hypothetical protein
MDSCNLNLALTGSIENSHKKSGYLDSEGDNTKYLLSTCLNSFDVACLAYSYMSWDHGSHNLNDGLGPLGDSVCISPR